MGLTSYKSGAEKATLSVKQASSATQGLGKNMDEMSHEMFHAAAAAGAFSAALLMVGKEVGTFAYNFDRNMTMVKAVSDITEMEFSVMTNMAREFGRQTEFGAAKAAEGMVVLGRMGLNAAQSMQVLVPALKLAQGQQYDMALTSETLVQQLKVFGEGMDKADKYANVLAATCNVTAANMEGLRYALAYVGPVAKVSGMDIEQLSGAMGILFNSGIQASTIGTSLRYAISSLLKPTKSTREALTRLGLSLDDVNLASKKFPDVMKLLAERLAGTKDKASLLFDLFDKRAAPAMAALVGTIIENKSALDDMTDAVTGTDAATRQYEVQMASFSGQMLLAQKAIEDMGIEFGKYLIPTLRMASSGIQSLSAWFRGLPDSIKSALAGFTMMITSTGLVVTGIAMFLYAGGQLKQILTTMSQCFNGVVNIIGSFVSSTVASNIATREFNTALNGSVVAATRKALSMHGLSAADKEYVIQQALVAAATQKTTAAQMVAYRASLKATLQSDALRISSQGNAAAAVKGAQGAATLAMANSGIALSSVAATSGLVRLAGGFKVLWGAMGGLPGLIIALATIAIPSLIVMFGKKHAQDLEEQRLTMERVSEYDKLMKKLDGLKGKYAETAASIEDNIKVEKRLKVISSDMNAVRATLGSIAPKYIRSITLSTNAVILETNAIKADVEALREYNEQKAIKEGKKEGKEVTHFAAELTKRVIDVGGISDTKVLTAELEKQKKEYENVKNSVDNYRLANIDNISAIDDVIRKTQLLDDNLSKSKYKEVSKQISETILNSDALSKKFEEAIDVTNDGSDATERTVNMQKLLNLGFINTARQLNVEKGVLAAYISKQRELEKTVGTATPIIDEFADTIDGAGGSASKAVKHFDGLLSTLRNLLEEMQKLSREVSIEKPMGESPFDAKMLEKSSKNMEILLKSTRDLEDATYKYFETVRAAEESKNPDDVLQLKIATDLINQLSGQYGILKTSIEEANIINKELFRKDTVNEYMDSIQEISNANEELAIQNSDGYANSIYKQIALSKQKLSVEMRNIDIQIKKEKSILSVDEQIRRVQITKITELEEKKSLLRIMYEEETNNKIEEMRKDHLLQLLEEEIRSQTPSVGVTGANYSSNNVFEASAKVKQNQTEIKGLQNILGQLTKNTQQYFDVQNMLSESSFQLNGNMETLSSSGVNVLIDSIGQLAARIPNLMDTFEKLGYVTEEQARSYSLAGETLSSVVSSFQSIESGDISGGLWGLVDTGLGLFSEMGDNAEKLNAEIEEEINSINAVAGEFVNFDISLFNANKSLQDFARTLLGISTSNESVYELVNTAAAEFDAAVKGISLTFTNVASALATTSLGTTRTNPTAAGFKAGSPIVTMLNNLYSAHGQSINDTGKVDPVRLMENLYRMGYKSTYDLLRPVVDSLSDTNKVILASGGTGAVNMLKGVLKGIGLTIPDSEIVKVVDAAQEVSASNELLVVQQNIYGAIDQGNADTTELLGTIVGKLENIASGKNAAIAPDKISAKEYLDTVDKLYQKRLVEAKTVGDIEYAINERIKALQILQGSPLWNQLTQLDKLDILDILKPEKIQEAFEVGIGNMLDNVASSSIIKNIAEIPNLFEQGVYSISDATNQFYGAYQQFRTLFAGDSFHQATAIWAKNLKEFATKIKETENSVKDIFGNLTDLDSGFRDSIAGLNDDMNGIIMGWNNLRKARWDLFKTFESESAKLKSESAARLEGLNEERDAILGVIDFSETQNIRSQRFAKAREVEQSIVDEIVKTSAALNEMTKKYQDDLDDIDSKLNDLADKYGSIRDVYELFAEKRKKLEDEYIAKINEEINLLRTLLGLTSSQLPDVTSVAGGTAGANVLATATPLFDSFKIGVQNMLKGLAYIYGLNGTSIDNLIVSLDKMITATNALRASWLGGEGNAPTGIQAFTPYAPSAIKMPIPIPSLGSITSAADGFEGLVNKPSTFNVAEKGIPEYVSVTPMKNLAKMANIGTNNAGSVTIHEHIDLRGAYGISSPEVAQRVWNEVWAPARRRAVSNVSDMRGRIQR
jgi:TP901 family phage tail tape measure protein